MLNYSRQGKKDIATFKLKINLVDILGGKIMPKNAKKVKSNKGELAVKIIAGILAVLMVMSVGGTLLFYLIGM